ncbi:glutaminase [Marinilabiliaceae bacterium JC017]|nr:glutaminase [Marinilabiliaceae bacterium JC017]
MDYQSIIEEIYKEVFPLTNSGKVADYIPELGKIDPSQLGIAIVTLDGKIYETGASRINFSIQSISKVFTLTLAMKFMQNTLWEKVGKEPSGNPFNSLVQLEYESGKPRNPFINAGAITIADCVNTHSENALDTIIQLMRNLSQNLSINFDPQVAQSEKEHGHRNAALAHFMKSFGQIDSSVDELLDIYYKHCSISMNCLDLAKAFSFLANHGINPETNETFLTKSQAKRINSLMLTCGMYDASGEFAYRVGIPGKSGVGGGITAIIPNLLSICVWSPGLDKYGNSLAGTMALELFTTKTGISIF